MPRVLIVEDSPTQAQEIAFYLEDAGFEVDIATDAERALERLADGLAVDLVASDVVMPGKSGYELCRALKADPATSSIPVVLLTSLRDPGELLEALQSGADSFLSKPVDPDELVRRLRSVLADKQLRLSEGNSPTVATTGRVQFHFDGKVYSAPADPGRLVGYFTAAFEDFLHARGREQEHAVAEAALREATRFLQATVDALPISIAILDERGTILAVNAVWQWGGATSALCNGEHRQGMNYIELLQVLATGGVTVASTVSAALEDVIAGARASFETEHSHTVDDDVRWFQVHITRFDDNGSVRVVVAHQEVTARKLAEQELREANARLEEALSDLKNAQATVVAQERLRALGQMASGIAHDFNNALAPILGYSEQLMVQRKVRENEEKLMKRLELIATSAKDAASVVSRLREFARPKSGETKFAPVQLPELVKSVIDLTRPRWGREFQAEGHAVELVTDFELAPAVPVDKSEIREVLTNLVFNALDAMPQGGTITFRLRAEDGWVRLEVRDTGGGMTEEQRARCLEPFFTTKGEHGTGLGLAMVFGIVKRHQGRFDVESEVGVGTACILRFRPVESSADESVDDIVDVSVRPLEVLVVDDEQVNRDVVRGYLELDAHVVVTADSGEAALAEFERGVFDIVVTDRAMPGMSGDQVAAGVKRLRPGVKVILLTGFGDLMDASGESPEGVDVVIGKPVGREGLQRAIAKLIKGRVEASR